METLTASVAPLKPPREWFERPEAREPTPLTFTADGQIYGHLATWDTCHRGFLNGALLGVREGTAVQDQVRRVLCRREDRDGGRGHDPHRASDLRHRPRPSHCRTQGSCPPLRQHRLGGWLRYCQGR